MYVCLYVCIYLGLSLAPHLPPNLPPPLPLILSVVPTAPGMHRAAIVDIFNTVIFQGKSGTNVETVFSIAFRLVGDKAKCSFIFPA